MIIAFVYADLLQSLTPIYRGLADGLVANVKEVMPNASILHLTDDETEGVKGCSVMRVKRKVGPMSWRLICQSIAHMQYPEILFTEPDVRFKVDVSDVFDQPFDVTVADREKKTTLKGEVVAPITLGANFSRSGDFWKDCAKHCLTLDHKTQLWGGDMTAVYHVMNEGKYCVLTLPASVYNHVPLSAEDTNAKMVHYKGNRKTWLFPLLEEAA